MPPGATDIELALAAQSGDVAALGALLERNRASLCATAAAMLGDYARAQDAVHDAFLIAITQLSTLRNPAAAGSWLRTIVRNVCRMQARANRETVDGDSALRLVDDLSPERVVDGLALRDWVWSAIDGLPRDIAATVMLRYFTRFSSYAEIADVLGTPIGTVRSRLNYARSAMAGQLALMAAAEHGDHAALLADRWQWVLASMQEMEQQGRATLYAERCAPDTVVEAHAASGTWTLAERQADVVGTLEIGVRARVADVVASADVTILDITFENPRDWPDHCPPRHAEVRYHRGARTDRITLYYQRADGLTAVVPS